MDMFKTLEYSYPGLLANLELVVLVAKGEVALELIKGFVAVGSEYLLQISKKIKIEQTNNIQFSLLASSR